MSFGAPTVGYRGGVIGVTRLLLANTANCPGLRSRCGDLWLKRHVSSVMFALGYDCRYAFLNAPKLLLRCAWYVEVVGTPWDYKALRESVGQLS
jgi:hypothetical protein